MPNLKQSLHAALEKNDLDAVVTLAKADRRALSLLVRLTYDKETLVGWRAIKAVGLAAQELVKADYEFLRETARKLLWSLSDESGGIGWAAPELLGEIVSADPARFCDVIPLIASVYDVEEEVFRPGVLYALAWIAEAAPERILSYTDLFLQGLSDQNPLTRIYALIALHNLGILRQDVMDRIQALETDTAEAWVYQGTGFKNIMVKELANQIINKTYKKQ